MVSGAFGLSGSERVLPTSVDQPKPSEYESVFFNLELFSERRSFFFRRRFLPGAGAFPAMMTIPSLTLYLFNYFGLNHQIIDCGIPFTGECTS